jgi:hypothetical protein
MKLALAIGAAFWAGLITVLGWHTTLVVWGGMMVFFAATLVWWLLFATFRLMRARRKNVVVK